jgi:hypothetical protein
MIPEPPEVVQIPALTNEEKEADQIALFAEKKAMKALGVGEKSLKAIYG